jgi:hypothetical protein
VTLDEMRAEEREWAPMNRQQRRAAERRVRKAKQQHPGQASRIPSPANYMPIAKAKRLIEICRQALVEHRLGAVPAVIEAVKDEPGYRHYFAVVAAVDSAMTETLAGEALWKMGVGVYFDMMAGRAPE